MTQQARDQRSPTHHPGERWEDRNMGARKNDHVRHRRGFKLRSRENWYRDVWLFIISAVVLATIVVAASSMVRANTASIDARRASEDAKKIAIDNAAFIRQIDREATARRDESCRYFERQELNATNAVIRTYHFLDSLRAVDKRTPLTREIVRSLPDTYADAKASKAPSYCDEPGVGLNEPGLKLPPLRDFSYLLR